MLKCLMHSPLPRRVILLSSVLLSGMQPATLLAADRAPVQVVQGMDVQRYAGTWFEIARFPNRFQKQCAGDVTATYTVQGDRTIRVDNTCRLADGKYDEAIGVARQKDAAGVNTQLEVRFAPAWMSWLPFVWADYWVIVLDADYRYAVVGTPDREYLWVLSRTPQMEGDAWAGLLEQVKAQGYDVGRLQKTVQSQPVSRP
jgi:apolipoprotein D and lipocalin family protein